MGEERICPRDAAELAACFAAHAGSLFGYARVLARGDRALADDLVQAAFEAAARDWATVRCLAEAQRRSWLRTTVANKAVSGFRREAAWRDRPAPTAAYDTRAVSSSGTASAARLAGSSRPASSSTAARTSGRGSAALSATARSAVSGSPSSNARACRAALRGTGKSRVRPAKSSSRVDHRRRVLALARVQQHAGERGGVGVASGAGGRQRAGCERVEQLDRPRPARYGSPLGRRASSATSQPPRRWLDWQTQRLAQPGRGRGRAWASPAASPVCRATRPRT